MKPDSAPERLPPAWPWALSGAALALLTGCKLLGLDRESAGFGQAVNHALDGLMWVGAGMCLLRVVRFRAERAPWLLLGLALAGSAAGDTLETFLHEPGATPVPSISDPFWLSFLVLGAAGLVLLARNRFLETDKSWLIDSGQAALIVAAAGLILLFYPTLENVPHAEGTPVVLLVVYPIGDTVLMSTLIAALALSGFRPGAGWLVLGSGLLLFSASDAVWALQLIGTGSAAGSVVEVGWAAAHVVIAYAAWMPPSYVRPVEKDDWRTAVLPAVVSVVSIGIQLGALVGAFPGKYPAARSLIIVAQTLLLVKLAETPRSYRRVRSRDPLTGLGNRYALACDLDACCRGRRGSWLLLMCEVSRPLELGGTRGRARRDALLVGLSASLSESVNRGARLYRDEEGDFLVLAPVEQWRDPGELTEVTVDAFRNGADVPLKLRYGAVTVPDEVADRTEALALAERRLESPASARPAAGVARSPLPIEMGP